MSKKTCRNWESTGSCKFGDRCHFSHEFADRTRGSSVANAKPKKWVNDKDGPGAEQDEDLAAAFSDLDLDSKGTNLTDSGASAMSTSSDKLDVGDKTEGKEKEIKRIRQKLTQLCDWEAVFGECKEVNCTKEHYHTTYIAGDNNIQSKLEKHESKLLEAYKPVTLSYFSLRGREKDSPSLSWIDLDRRHYNSRCRVEKLQDLQRIKIPVTPLQISSTFVDDVDWVKTDYQSCGHTRFAFESWLATQSGSGVSPVKPGSFVTERNNLNKILCDANWNIGVQRIGHCYYMNKYKNYIAGVNEKPCRLFIGGSGNKFEAICTGTTKEKGLGYGQNERRFYMLIKSSIGDNVMYVTGETDGLYKENPAEITTSAYDWGWKNSPNDVDQGTRKYFQSLITGVNQIIVGQQENLGGGKKEVQRVDVLSLSEVEKSPEDKATRIAILHRVLSFIKKNIPMTSKGVYRLERKGKDLTLYRMDDIFRFAYE